MRRESHAKGGEPESFESEMPARGGVLESSEVLPSAARRASWDRADKAFDVMVNSIAVLTTQNGDDMSGLVVSTVATASQNPPMFTVAVRRSHPAAGLIRASRMLAINFLPEEAQTLLERFGAHAVTGNAQFAGVEYDRGVSSGTPILRSALAFVEGKVVHSIAEGDHTIFVAEVLDGGSLRDGTPMTRQGSYKPTVSQ